jgi:hypothetical protein
VRALLKGGDNDASEREFLLKLGRQRATLCNESSSLGKGSTELCENGDAMLEYG